MRIVEHGWLPAMPELDDFVSGIYIPKATKTRKEEYTFVRDALPEEPGKLLDLATGYVPEWHLFACIAGEEGWLVDALDENPNVFNLPSHPNVAYWHADAKDVPFADHSFDCVTCISTLEHLPQIDQQQIVAEMLRCCKVGGRLILTADFAFWLPLFFGATEVDTEGPQGAATYLNPPVYYVIVDT